MSFELKPKHTGGRGRADLSLWTQPRSSVPLILVNAGVSLSTWHATDAVQHCIEEEQFMAENIISGGLFFIPCFALCAFSRMRAAAQEMDQLWADMLRKEQAKYQPLHIQVSFSRELVPMGAGSHRHLTNRVVGLKFVLLTPIVSASDGGDIAGQLEELNGLYENGIRSKDEYKRAKEKVLG